MNHLVRIDMNLCIVPEDQVWSANADYGPIDEEQTEFIFGPPPTSEAWKGVAAWLREKGF